MFQNLHRAGGHHTVSGGAYGFGLHPLFKITNQGASYGSYAERVGCTWAACEKEAFEERALRFGARVEDELERVFGETIFSRTVSDTMRTLREAIDDAPFALPPLAIGHMKAFVTLVVNKGVNTTRHCDDDATYGLLATMEARGAHFVFDDLGLRVDFNRRAIFYAAAVVAHHQECNPEFVNVGMYVQRRLLTNVLRSCTRKRKLS